MGNNKKTVKCSFCGRLGHNRVSCPKLKEMIEKERKEHGSSHPDVKLYDELKRQYSNKSKSNASSKRFCSYCKSPSHNIRTCTHRERDFHSLKKVNYEWKKNILAELKSRGIGVGCLMTTVKNLSSIENKNSPWTLVSIDWSELNWIIDNRKIFKLVMLKNPSYSRTLSLEQILNDSPTYNFAWKVISPSDNLNLPDRWDEIGDPIFDQQCVEIFKGLTKTDYDSMFFSLWENKPRDLRFLNPIGFDLNKTEH